MWLDPSGQSLEEQLRIVGAMSAGDLFGAAFGYDWDSHPFEVLGAIADRPDCSLLTALLIFTQASPESYADEASQRRKPRHVEFLDRIQKRINTGGYRHLKEDHKRVEERLAWNWTPREAAAPFMGPRQEPGGNSATTVWWLDPQIVLPACPTDSEVQAMEDERDKALKEVAMSANRGIFDMIRKHLNADDKAKLLASLDGKSDKSPRE
jgi:hypothetical protein